ncbi:MAG TPA: hypothetical protein VK845_11485 [Gemmatimonadales bacterium]|nr:hypothetical protein [Gemmatimonadales bacterium]
MRRYWIGIAFGVLAVFVSGLVLMRAGREGARLVERTLESADPISIPLAFVPFRLGGREVGTIREVQFLRSSPEVVRGVDLDVRVEDRAVVDKLRDCTLATSGIGNFNRKTSFECLDQTVAQSGEFVSFGTVTVEETGIVRALFIPAKEVARWQHDDSAQHAQHIQPQTMERLAQAIAQIKADSGGLTINVWDALKQAGLQFKADSDGAVLHIADEASGAKLFMRADSSGVVIDAKGGADSSKLQLKADSSGLLLNIHEGSKSTTRSVSKP